MNVLEKAPDDRRGAQEFHFPFYQETLTRYKPFVLSIPGQNHGNEDSFYAGSYGLSVTDGVSRSRLPDGTYPEPSGAQLAAQRFALVSGKYIDQYYSDYSLDVIAEAFFVGNESVAQLNTEHHIPEHLDFGVYDYYSCCAVVARIIEPRIKGKHLHIQYGSIGDCQIAIFNRDEQLKLITPNHVKDLEDVRESLPFTNKDDRLIQWRRLRNHPKANHLSYGTLTGESTALAFVEYGMKDLSLGDQILIFSDGFEQFVKRYEFRQLLRKNPSAENVQWFVQSKIDTKAVTQNVHDDKTIISIIIK
jgi:serine/threonine protein phosphatase PrpC